MIATTELVVGTKAKLAPTPFDASNRPLSGRAFAYSSSAPSVATVDATGVVTAVAEGVATITASAEGKSATTLVRAFAAVSSIAMSQAGFNAVVGKTSPIAATARDANGVALARAFTWASSNNAVATVDTAGNVTTVTAGQVTITASYGSLVGSIILTTRALMTMDAAIAAWQAAGHEVRSAFDAGEVAPGFSAGQHWTAHFAKAGLTIPDMIIEAGVSRAFKNGVKVLRAAGGYIRSAAATTAYSLPEGLAVYVFGTAKTAGGSIASVQDVADFGTAGRFMALITDNGSQGRPHPRVVYGSPSDSYDLRCTLDDAMRSWGFSIAPVAVGETKPRYNVMRSAKHNTQDHNDITHGRGNWAASASDVAAPASGANFLQLFQFDGIDGNDFDDVAAFVVTGTPMDATSAKIAEQLAQDTYGALPRTGKEVVVIGDSKGLQFSGGRPDLTLQTWTLASDDGANAGLQELLPGYRVLSGCWQGESAWSAVNHRLGFSYPLWLDVGQLDELIVIIEDGANDVWSSAEYNNPGGAVSINADLLSLVAWIRALPNADKIKIVLNTVGPAWVNGAASPGDTQEVTRVALNALIRAQTGPNRIRDVTLDPTIGQPGENTNAANYIQDALLVHYQETNGTGPGIVIRQNMVQADVLALAA